MFDLARHVFGRASNMVHQYASTDVRYQVSQDAPKMAMSCDHRKLLQEEEELPSAQFSFDLSPLVLQVKRVCVTLVCTCFLVK